MELSTDPFFIEKHRDIVGLYPNPPKSTVVLCVDDKSRRRALERTQPVLPMAIGYVEGVTHETVRQGTTALFPALDQVARWFGIITQRAIRRGSLRGVKERRQKIDQSVAAPSRNATPFMLHATADSILKRLGPRCTPASGAYRQGPCTPPL